MCDFQRMQRPDRIRRTAPPRNLLSGLLVLLLMLVWQAAPGLRQMRPGAGADRAVTTRLALPAETLKSLQIAAAVKSGEDRLTGEPPVFGLPPLVALCAAPEKAASCRRLAPQSADLRPRSTRPEARAPPPVPA